MYRWIVFLHVLGAFTFVMAHGASANISFKLRRETSRERIGALLDLSTAYFGGMYGALLVMLLTGIALGFVGNWWGQGWIWLALALLLAKLFAMFTMAARSFTQLRQAVGLPYFDGKPHPAAPPASPEEIAARAAAINPIPIAVVGFGGLALIVWLMMFKPF